MLAAQGNPRKVILSRYDKPIREVPVDEVADEYAKRLNESGIEVPFNTVPPALRDALVRRGVKICEPQKGNAGEAARKAYEMWRNGEAGDTASRFVNGRDEDEREVVERARENGTYMKAPNGKPTKLNEKQWAQVRTKAFKNWFGDWELPSKTVGIVSGNTEHGFKNYGEARRWAKANIARIYDNEETGGKGNINISNTAVEKFLSESSISKSDDKNVHMSVLRVLPDVIRESIEAESHPDYKKVDGKRSPENGINENVIIHRLYGAVNVDGDIYRVKITLKRDVRDSSQSKAYSYEATKIELLAGHTGKSADFPRYSSNSISAAKLLKDVEKSYGEGEKILNNSRVLDENGEPLVVYHGTTAYEEKRTWNEQKKEYDTEYSPFNVFKRHIDGQRNAGFFFNSNPDNAGGYGYNTYDTYLNLRNPLVIDCHGDNYSSIRFDGKEMDTYGWAEYAEKKGYDGLILQNVSDGVGYNDLKQTTTDYVAFKSTRIKSATDNSGEFSKQDDDITFRFTNGRDEGKRDGVRSRKQTDKKIEVIPDESETTSINGAPEFTSSKDGRLETAKLLKDVEKSYDKGVKLLEESKPAAKETFWGMVERLADEAGRAENGVNGSLHPKTQNEKSVSLGDSRAATEADNKTAPLGISSPAVSDDKYTYSELVR